MRTGIYRIVSPIGKIYIGQSKNIAKRWADYKRGKMLTFHLNNSFNTYGMDNHKFEIIELCDSNLLNERERFYQDLLDACGNNGLNCLLTKTKDKSQSLRQDFKDRISLAFKNKPHHHISPNQLLVFNPFTGVYYDSVTMASESLGITQVTLNNNLTGKTDFNSYPIVYAYDDEKRDRIIEERRDNRKINRSPRKAQKNFASKMVLNTENGIYYKSVIEAAESINMKRSTLAMMLKGHNRNKTSLIYA